MNLLICYWWRDEKREGALHGVLEFMVGWRAVYEEGIINVTPIIKVLDMISSGVMQHLMCLAIHLHGFSADDNEGGW